MTAAATDAQRTRTRAVTRRIRSRDDLSERERKLAELCIHEAAHAVAGVVYGGRLRAASVTGGFTAGPLRGRTTFDSMPPGRECEVAYAGVWGTARWRADRTPLLSEVYRVLDGAGRQDRAVLSAAGGPARGASVAALIERCWPSVRTLAGKICSAKVVRHTDVCTALGIPAKDNGHELALIRAGAAPGSFTVTRPAAV